MSQLLNQIDGAGPPPLTKEKIQEIPTTLISQDHLGKNELFCCTIFFFNKIQLSKIFF